MRSQKFTTQFFLSLIFLLLISTLPACACPCDRNFISIIPIPVIIIMAGVLTASALSFKKRLKLTIPLLVVVYIVVSVLGPWIEPLALFHYGPQLLAMLPLLIFLNLIYLYFDEKKDRSRRRFTIAAVGGVVLCVVFFIGLSGTGRLIIRSTGYSACQSNLKNIATALEMYAADNKGKYPDSMGQLVPDYFVKQLPRCIPYEVSDRTKNYVRVMYREQIDDYKYTVSADHKKYTMWCSGTNHDKIYDCPDYPQYNSQQGLVNRR